MLERIFSLLLGEAQLPREGGDLKLAVAALLVEAARMDDVFDEAEHRTIVALLRHRFRIDEATAGTLLARAEKAEAGATGAYRFTKAAVEQLTPTERIGLIEMMWEVAYADGVLTPDEDALVRRVAGLLHVEDLDRGAARRRVLARLGLADGEVGPA
jgi:uncharacterized tellurite resistance protein B-like protein